MGCGASSQAERLVAGPKADGRPIGSPTPSEGAGAAATDGVSACAHFEVHTGPCRGRFDGVVISTDMEPDDVACIKALAPRLRGVPLLVVVGEGDAPMELKAALAADVLERYGLRADAAIVPGRPSRVRYPREALRAYRDDAGTGGQSGEGGAESGAEGGAEGGGAEGGGADAGDADGVACLGASSRVAAFLQCCASPFALLLKPPHEFANVPPAELARTTGVLYGSFNLECLRAVMVESDPSLSASDALHRQSDLLGGFKSLVWLERSTSVGRDATIHSGQLASVWPPIAADSALVQLIVAWNDAALRKRISRMPALESSLGPRLDLEPTAAGRFTLTQQALDSLGEDGEVFATLNGGSASERCSYEERYSDSSAVVEPGANRGDGSAPLPPKDVAIIRSIASARGLQMCLADTLAAAVLTDDKGKLTPYLHAASAEGIKPKRLPPATSSGDSMGCSPRAAATDGSPPVLSALFAASAERGTLVALVLGILTAAYGESHNNSGAQVPPEADAGDEQSVVHQ